MRHWEDAYLKDGYFDGDRMIRVLRGGVLEATARATASRGSWATWNGRWKPLPGVTDIVEYETKLNYVLPKYPDPVVCVYDLNKHSGSVVMDILRTHPMVIVGGVLQENPLYVAPGRAPRRAAHRRKEEPAAESPA